MVDLSAIDPGHIGIDVGSFLIVVVAGAIAGTIAALASARNLLLPSVVLELLLGILIGPQVLGIAHVNGFTQFFADLGLGMLFFFAGYEIDLRRIGGRPLRLAAFGWALSLFLAYTFGGILAAAGIVLSLLYTGSALATTAIGTLIPILSDSGELETRFGTYLLAAGAVGEFGPILLLTLILTTQSAVHSAVILVAFVALAVAVAVLAVRSAGKTLPVFERTLEQSSQLAVRWIVVLVFALALLASNLGLDLLLGGFAAGLITREVLRGREVNTFDSKLTAVGFGFFIPFFFVFSGMSLAISALFQSPSGVVKLFVFLALFLVVRGVPALLLYRSVLKARDRAALAFFTSTQLPLVLAITTVAVASGHMRASTAAALVSAAVLSTLIYPLMGLRLRESLAGLPKPAQAAPEPATAPSAAP
jgi:Kef-type K+ transport system membrane component KefB